MELHISGKGFASPLDVKVAYTLLNEGDSVLWLVDDSASDSEFLTEPLILLLWCICRVISELLH